MRFIHISDLHLGSCPNAEFKWGEKRGEELWERLAAVAAVCNDENIQLLLIAGDLFDRPPVWDELERVNEIFNGLKQTQVVMIAGDSDYITAGSPWLEFSWRENVHLLADKFPQSIYFGDIDTTVIGCSYHSPEVTQPYLEMAKPDNDGDIQILLGHTGDSRHMPADLSVIESLGFDYAAFGHLHRAQIQEKLRLAYSGSLEPLCAEDMGEHGYITGELGVDKPTIRFVPFAQREYVSIKVRITSDTPQSELEQRLVGAMESKGRNNIYSIILEGRFNPGRPYDAESLMKLGNVVNVEDNTMPDYNIVELVQDHGDDVIGMYLEEFLKEHSGEQQQGSQLKLQQRAMYCGLEALLAGSEEQEKKGTVEKE